MTRNAFRLACTTALVLSACTGAQPGSQWNSPGPEAAPPAASGAHAEVTAAERFDTSPPLALIPPAQRIAGFYDHEVKPLPRPGSVPGGIDPVHQTSMNASVSMMAPAVASSFEGIGAGFSGPGGTFTVHSAPPDTTGDIGPNHYVQSVNSDFAVLNKSGTVLYGPVQLNTLWSGFGGLCETDNDGDPLVLWDPIANRWVISQFAVTNPNPNYYQCVAVSTTADPTGTYYRYAFSYAGFNDYGKMGVWPDGYYITYNMFGGTPQTFQGSKVCAFDRSKMLTGAAATQQCYDTGVNYGGALPTDLDGARLPPAGAPNTVLALGATANTLALWKFHVDWTTPANSSFTGPTTINVAAFNSACTDSTGALTACILQGGTTQKLDSLSDRLMYRLAYRNFGDHEAYVVNHSVTAGSSVGVRWYELRPSGSSLSVYQQGTYAPDSAFRWIGSTSQDQNGNIALGFSHSSATTKPALHFTARKAGDALGVMTQGEGSLIDGAGAQGTTLSRWGDYSMLGVDPTDDCTFWFTSEYIPADGTFNWHTRIGSFKIAGCGPAAPPPATGSLTNGGFESGLTGWTAAGSTSTSATSHSGAASAMVGSTGPTTDSSLSQTFTLPSNASSLSFWHQIHCADTVSYDWASATLKDNVTGTTSTLLANTCTNAATWVQVSANVSASAGHSVTLTLANHDDNYAGDVTYSLFDDVAVSTGTVSPPPPTTTDLISNGGFENALTGWTLGGVQAPIQSTVAYHGGTHSMRLGATTASGATEPNGDSWGYQSVAIPSTATKATLTFWYYAATTDTITYDWQDAQVRSSSGATLINIFHLCSNAQVWTQQTVDVTAYKGSTVQVYFNAHGEGATDPTTLWVDDVSLTVQ